MQSLWETTPDETRASLIAAMSEAVECSGTKTNPEFPMVNKIVELRLIGRRHPLG